MPDTISEFSKEIPMLFGQTRVSFLFGAGCSLCAGLPLMDSLTKQICEKLDPAVTFDPSEKIAFGLLKEIQTRYELINTVSIEDFLSEIQDIDAILARQQEKGIVEPNYNSGTRIYKSEHIQIVLKAIKKNIVDILKVGVTNINIHRNFVRSIHYGLIQGRERAQSPVNYFVLNYDTLIEDALALEGIVFSDGFVGGATAWWDPQCFGGEDQLTVGTRRLAARIYKLHGSIDWVKPDNSEFPIRIRASLPVDSIIGTGETVVIYPASAKYVETQHDPYSQMMISFRKHLAQTSNHVLGIMGYGFNDEHINVEIENGIRKSNGALSVIVFLGSAELPRSVEKWINDETLSLRIFIFGKNGVWKHGKKILESSDDLDWYRFENITQIIGG